LDELFTSTELCGCEGDAGVWFAPQATIERIISKASARENAFFITILLSILTY